MKLERKKYIGKILIGLGFLMIVSVGMIKLHTIRCQEDRIHAFLTYRDMCIEDIKQSIHNMQGNEVKVEDDQQSTSDVIDNSKYNSNVSTEDQINTLDDQERQTDKQYKFVDSHNLIGIMKIPKIQLEVSIAEGTDKKALQYSIGHVKETKMAGEVGNACYIGHRSYAFGEYFNRLDELSKGDKIEILSATNTYHYEVTKSFVVEPEEISVLDDTNEEMITLITCTPVRIATHRLIVTAKRVE